MTEMVDRVALVLEHYSKPDEGPTLGEFDYWSAMARVAITAMREPTEAMLDGAALWRDRWDAISVREQWQNLIDYALQASEGGGSP